MLKVNNVDDARDDDNDNDDDGNSGNALLCVS